jgi:hypothetical protein
LNTAIDQTQDGLVDGCPQPHKAVTEFFKSPLLVQYLSPWSDLPCHKNKISLL